MLISRPHCARRPPRMSFEAPTIYVVDFQPRHVLGCSEFGGCEEVGVVDGEIFIVIFQDHQCRALDAEEIKKKGGGAKFMQSFFTE